MVRVSAGWWNVESFDNLIILPRNDVNHGKRQACNRRHGTHSSNEREEIALGEKGDRLGIPSNWISILRAREKERERGRKEKVTLRRNNSSYSHLARLDWRQVGWNSVDPFGTVSIEMKLGDNMTMDGEWWFLFYSFWSICCRNICREGRSIFQL